ncbi:MAG: DUF4221 family protein [Bacteroidales bacterium]
MNKKYYLIILLSLVILNSCSKKRNRYSDFFDPIESFKINLDFKNFTELKSRYTSFLKSVIHNDTLRFAAFDEEKKIVYIKKIDLISKNTTEISYPTIFPDSLNIQEYRAYFSWLENKGYVINLQPFYKDNPRILQFYSDNGKLQKSLNTLSNIEPMHWIKFSEQPVTEKNGYSFFHTNMISTFNSKKIREKYFQNGFGIKVNCDKVCPIEMLNIYYPEIYKQKRFYKTTFELCINNDNELCVSFEKNDSIFIYKEGKLKTQHYCGIQNPKKDFIGISDEFNTSEIFTMIPYLKKERKYESFIYDKHRNIYFRTFRGETKVTKNSKTLKDEYSKNQYFLVYDNNFNLIFENKYDPFVKARYHYVLPEKKGIWIGERIENSSFLFTLYSINNNE